MRELGQRCIRGQGSNASEPLPYNLGHTTAPFPAPAHTIVVTLICTAADMNYESEPGEEAQLRGCSISMSEIGAAASFRVQAAASIGDQVVGGQKGIRAQAGGNERGMEGQVVGE